MGNAKKFKQLLRKLSAKISTKCALPLKCAKGTMTPAEGTVSVPFYAVPEVPAPLVSPDAVLKVKTAPEVINN